MSRNEKCELCDKEYANIYNHYKSKKHLDKVNGIEKKEKVDLCVVCNRPQKNMYQHLQTASHKTKVEQLEALKQQAE